MTERKPRNPDCGLSRGTPRSRTGAWAAEVEGAAVVNLAGESIGARRWSAAQKQRILESRVRATRSLAQAIRAAPRSALALISGSAVGYYGPLHDEVVREDHAAGSDFLARVCAQWEAEAVQGVGGATRVVCIRTGLALEKDGGALPRMLTPFKLGAGGPLGSGRQYWPWIHRADWVALVRWAIDTSSVSGAHQRHGAESGDECGVHASARASAASPGVLAGARLRAAARARGNGRRAAVVWAERGAGEGGAVGIPFSSTRALDDALHAIFARDREEHP